jgi:hypothetical protein
LAASRFHEWVQDQAENDIDAIASVAMADIESKTVPLADEYRKRVILDVKTGIQIELDEFFKKKKRRIKNLEVFLIVIGTFINGFGDYLIGLLKSSGV